ncbi:unnamed protein product, partial [Dicrocoelium dendriticum]
APITNLFGCVDEVVINGIGLDPQLSGRPRCYDCFSLDPKIVHVPSSIKDQLRTDLIPLEIPPVFLRSDLEQLTFDFSLFHDRDRVTTSSLFVLAFEGESPEIMHRIWLYLTNAE